MTLTKLKKPVETQAYAFLPKNLCTGESYESEEPMFMYKNVADAMNVDYIPEDTTLAIIVYIEDDDPISAMFFESPVRVITAFRLISYVSFDFLHLSDTLFDILEAGPNAIKNLMALYPTEIEEFTTVKTNNTAFIMTEQDLHGEYQCSREVKAYDSTKAFFRALPKTKPEHCYIYTVSVNSVKEISDDLVQKISATLVKKLQEHPVNFIQYLAKFKDLQETIGNRYKNFKLTHDSYCEIINATVAKLEKKSFTVAIHKFDQLDLKIDISGWG